MTDHKTTQEKILDAGKMEFLEHGFKSASLRNIVKNAGFTLGAFYGYYKDKQALFEALVAPFADTLREMFEKAQEEFTQLSAEVQIDGMNDFSSEKLYMLVDYIYEHFDAFKLLITCSEGTSFEEYIDVLVEIEVKNTIRFMDIVKKYRGSIKHELSISLMHILARGFFSGIFEVIVHDMPKEEAVTYIDHLTGFYQAGWNHLLGLK